MRGGPVWYNAPVYFQVDSTESYPIREPLRECLTEALDHIDAYLAETLYALHHNDGESLEETWLYETLPPRFKSKMNETMCRNLATTLKTVREKLFSHATAEVGCPAEEIILGWALHMAADFMLLTDLNLARLKDQVADFFDAVFSDVDFELAYNLRLDGIENEEHVNVRAFRVEEWFNPYDPAKYFTVAN